MSSSSTPVGSQTWEERIQSASAVLGKTIEEVEAVLDTLGVSKAENGLEMLSDESVTPFGDLRRAFCEESDVKIAKLRMAIKYLRGPKESEKASDLDPDALYLKQTFGIKRKASDIDPVELIPRYNPHKKSSTITGILKEKLKDQAVIAFKPGTKDVAVEETVNYISDLQQGLEELDKLEVDGELVRLYPVGVVPDESVSEDPLFPGQALRRERSTVNRVNWTELSLAERQFCRLILEADEIDPNDKLAVRELLKLASDGIKTLKEVYPEVGLEFRERKEDGDLPRLKIKVSEIKNGSSNDPFGVGGNRKF